MDYTLPVIEIRETQEFSTWLESLRDARARGMMQLARDTGRQSGFCDGDEGMQGTGTLAAYGGG